MTGVDPDNFENFREEMTNKTQNKTDICENCRMPYDMHNKRNYQAEFTCKKFKPKKPFDDAVKIILGTQNQSQESR